MFIRLTRFLLVTLALVVHSECAEAQVVGDGGSPYPGVVYNGQRFGFLPGNAARSQNAAMSSNAVEDGATMEGPIGNDGAAWGNGQCASGTCSSGCGTSYPPQGPLWKFLNIGCLDNDGDGCADMPEFYARGEYVLFWTHGMHTPVLATTSPAGTTQANAGVLGLATTTNLFGGNLNSTSRSGGRFTLGMWLDPSQTTGIEATFLYVADGNQSFSGSNNNFNILARPFFNANTGAEDSRLIAFPGVTTGTLNVTSQTAFQTFDMVLRQAIVQNYGFSLDGVLGFRYGRLSENLTMTDSTLAAAGSPIAGTQLNSFDRFGTANTFYGGEMGLICQWQDNPCWSWEGVAKVALGQTNAVTNVNGQTVITTAAGVPTTTNGGLFTQGTNIGKYNQNTFGTMSEFGLTARRHFENRWTATFGYSFLLWSRVHRAGDQIDRNIDPTQPPLGNNANATRPAFPNRGTDFWAQGLRFGLERSF